MWVGLETRLPVQLSVQILSHLFIYPQGNGSMEPLKKFCPHHLVSGQRESGQRKRGQRGRGQRERGQRERGQRRGVRGGEVRGEGSEGEGSEGEGSEGVESEQACGFLF